jgi:DNA-binding NarL/FixJ family response regulator
MRPRSLRAIRVLLVEDNDDFAAALTDVLDADSRIDRVGRAADGKEAIRLVAELKPDVVTMDLAMPKMNGVETIKALMSTPSLAVPIIVVSASESGGLLGAALAAGAVAYVPKLDVTNRLLEAIVDAARCL